MVLPWGVAMAANGDIYFAQAPRNLVLRVRADGILQRVAGSLRSSDIGKVGDGGPALDAYIGFPRSVALDPTGNVYVGDSRARLRRIDAVTGIITTIAGNGTAGFSGDGGPAIAALLTQPSHLTSTSDGTIYFLDDNVRVRKITPGGIISTVAGNGTVGESGDGGPATSAQLNSPTQDGGDLAVDADGNLFILETEGARVRKVDARNGLITTFAATNAGGKPLQKPRAIAIDGSGNVYASESGSILKFDRDGRLVESWGTGHGFSEDGAEAKTALIGSPMGMTVAPNGDIIWSEESPSRLRRIVLSTGRIETIAGIAPGVIGIPGPATGAVFTSPWGDLSFAPSGDLFFADGNSYWIYRIRNGIVSTFAGTGMSSGFYEEGTATETNVNSPSGMETGPDGNLYFVNRMSVRWIDASGVVHRYAGAPTLCGFSGDGGPAGNALMCQPQNFVFDGHGDMFIADTNNNRIRRVDAVTKIITTVAGGSPRNGFEGYGRGSQCGDGGPAVEACLNTPIAVAVRDDGTMFIVDQYNNPSIRKVTPDGIITSVSDWPQLPKGLTVGPGQSIFANGGNRIFRVDGDRVRSIAGNGIHGFGGDGGPAGQARIAPGEAERSWGIAIDAEGNLFIHDAGNRRIRAVRYGAVLAPTNATIQANADGLLIRFIVLDPDGHTLPGIRVDVKSPATGPSCTLSAPFVITDSEGAASVTCIPNCHGGTYDVIGQPLGAASTTGVSFTNVSVPCRRRSVRH